MTNEERNLPATNSDVNAEDSEGKTPLMRAEKNGDSEEVKTLFDGRTDVDAEGMQIAAPATANPASDFEYTKSADKVTITGLKNKEMDGKIVIPRTIDGLPVTSIGDSAFWGCSGLTSVTIPESVTSIGEDAFWGCSGLTSVTIPESVTSIGSDAFGNCKNLTSIEVASANAYYQGIDGVLFTKDGKTIHSYPNGKSGSSYRIPESVTSIGEDAFWGCSGLTSVTIPESVTSIGSDAFGNCKNLTSIEVASANAYYQGIDGVLFTKDGKTIHSYPNGKSGSSYRIPESVTSIGDSAFWGCSGLTSVTIPESVTSIGEAAFFACDNLTSVTIPKSVTSIGEAAFFACDNLTSMTIPESVTCIDESAFYGCRDLTSLTIPASVTSIGEAAFFACDNLTSMTIPASVTYIGEAAFSGCSGLTSLTLPESVTYIGEKAFEGCSGLTSVTIPESVMCIGENAFYGCSGLTSIEVASGNAYYQCIDGVLFTKDGKTIHSYPAGKKGSSYNIPESVTCIEESAFYGCRDLTSVTIPKSVTSIGENAFLCCDNLTIRTSKGSAAEEYAKYSGIKFETTDSSSR